MRYCEWYLEKKKAKKSNNGIVILTKEMNEL